MQHGFLAGGIQLEHRAAARPAAIAAASEYCRAIEVPRRVADQAPCGNCPVRSAHKAVEHGLLAARIQHEHRAAASPAAIVKGASGWGSAVEVARAVPDYTRIGIIPVRSAATKRIENGECLSSRRWDCD